MTANIHNTLFNTVFPTGSGGSNQPTSTAEGEPVVSYEEIAKQQEVAIRPDTPEPVERQAGKNEQVQGKTPNAKSDKDSEAKQTTGKTDAKGQDKSPNKSKTDKNNPDPAQLAQFAAVTHPAELKTVYRVAQVTARPIEQLQGQGKKPVLTKPTATVLQGPQPIASKTLPVGQPTASASKAPKATTATAIAANGKQEQIQADVTATKPQAAAQIKSTAATQGQVGLQTKGQEVASQAKELGQTNATPAQSGQPEAVTEFLSTVAPKGNVNTGATGEKTKTPQTVGPASSQVPQEVIEKHAPGAQSAELRTPAMKTSNRESNIANTATASAIEEKAGAIESDRHFVQVLSDGMAGASAEANGATAPVTSGPVTGATTPQASQNTANAQPDPQVGTQIADSVRSSNLQAGQEIVIRLDPPELGRVRIALRLENGELRGEMRVENPRTFTEMRNETPALIERLTTADIQVRRLDVVLNNNDAASSSGSFDLYQQDSAQQGDDRQQNNGNGNAEGMAQMETTEDPTTTSGTQQAQVSDESINFWI